MRNVMIIMGVLALAGCAAEVGKGKVFPQYAHKVTKLDVVFVETKSYPIQVKSYARSVNATNMEQRSKRFADEIGRHVSEKIIEVMSPDIKEIAVSRLEVNVGLGFPDLVRATKISESDVLMISPKEANLGCANGLTEEVSCSIRMSVNAGIFDRKSQKVMWAVDGLFYQTTLGESVEGQVKQFLMEIKKQMKADAVI